MKILSHNSEAKLFEKVKSLKDQPHSSWRCLYFHHVGGAQMAALRERWLAGMLASFADDAEGYVYLCCDGDVFILFQGAVRHIRMELARHFGGLIDQPCTLFDLGVHWSAFYHLCKSKFAHALILHDDMPPLYSYHRRAQAYAEVVENREV